MPKVDEAYFEKKRNLILDAALAVCSRKPIYRVTMRDIITESGLSQGGIYRYYFHLNDILFALINRGSTQYQLKKQVDDILSSADIPEKIIARVLHLLSSTMEKHLETFGKIYYELSAMFLQDQKALAEFHSKVTISAEINYLKENSFQYVLEKINEGYFKPKVALDAIFPFLVLSIDGLERDFVLLKYYPSNETTLPFTAINIEKNIQCLVISFIFLLGGDPDLVL